MAVVSGQHELVRFLIDRLGIPKHCTRFVITCAADDVMRVECEFYPEEHSAETLTKRFVLHEAD